MQRLAASTPAPFRAPFVPASAVADTYTVSFESAKGWCVGMPVAQALYMSSYRRLDTSLTITEDTRGELYPFRSKRSSQPKGDASTQPANNEEAYKHLRKGQPANIPLPRTKAWFESLPPRTRPSALMRQFPRIANLIAAAWDDLVQFETYMDSLLTDKRAGRKGFPSDVIAELGALDVYRHTVRESASTIAWSDVGRRG